MLPDYPKRGYRRSTDQKPTKKTRTRANKGTSKAKPTNRSRGKSVDRNRKPESARAARNRLQEEAEKRQMAGSGKTSSVALCPDCAPCHYLPDDASGARPVPRTTHPPGKLTPGGPGMSLAKATLPISPYTAPAGAHQPFPRPPNLPRDPIHWDQSLYAAFEHLASLV